MAISSFSVGHGFRVPPVGSLTHSHIHSLLGKQPFQGPIFLTLFSLFPLLHSEPRCSLPLYHAIFSILDFCYEAGVTRFSKTSAVFYQTTWHHIPKFSSLRHCRTVERQFVWISKRYKVYDFGFWEYATYICSCLWLWVDGRSSYFVGSRT
jgi:hypothetical protein